MDNKNSQFYTIKEVIQKIVSSPEIKSLKENVCLALQNIKTWYETSEAKILLEHLVEFQKISDISKHGWCILDEELKNKITKLSDISQNEFDAMVVNYYSANNYQVIKEKFNQWSVAPFLAARLPILKSCLTACEYLENKDLFNITIPTLLAQEDGLLDDIYSLIPSNDIDVIIKKDNLLKGQKRDIVVCYFWYNGYKNLAIYAKKILVENTFRYCKNKILNLSDEDYMVYDKYRNKILHGDNGFLKYGTAKNYIQSWLELELLFFMYLAILTITDEISNNKGLI